MKAPQNVLAALGRKIALNIAYDKDERAEQERDFKRVVQEKLQTAAEPARGVYPAESEQPPHKPVESAHTQELGLYEIPNHWQQSSALAQLNEERKSRNAHSVSQFSE